MKNKVSFFRLLFEYINKKWFLNIMWIFSIVFALSLFLVFVLLVVHAGNVEVMNKILFFNYEFAMKYFVSIPILASVFWFYNLVVCYKRRDKFSHFFLLLFFNVYYSPIYYFLRIYLKSNSLNNSEK